MLWRVLWTHTTPICSQLASWFHSASTQRTYLLCLVTACTDVRSSECSFMLPNDLNKHPTGCLTVPFHYYLFTKLNFILKYNSGFWFEWQNIWKLVCKDSAIYIYVFNINITVLIVLYVWFNIYLYYWITYANCCLFADNCYFKLMLAT